MSCSSGSEQRGGSPKRPLDDKGNDNDDLKAAASDSQEISSFLWPSWNDGSPKKPRPGTLEVQVHWVVSGSTNTILVPAIDCTLAELQEVIEKDLGVPRHDQLLRFCLDGPELSETVKSPHAPLPGVIAGASLALVRFDSEAAWSELNGEWIGKHQGCYGDGPEMVFRLHFSSGGRFTGSGNFIEEGEEPIKACIAGQPLGGAVKPKTDISVKLEIPFKDVYNEENTENTYCCEATLTWDEGKACLRGSSLFCLNRGRDANFRWLASGLDLGQADDTLNEETTPKGETQGYENFHLTRAGP